MPKTKSLDAFKFFLPDEIMDVTYNSANYPGANQLSIYEQGGNCQVFAYELLKINGILIPPFRSSELWEDKIYTCIAPVHSLQPLDLLFFNREAKFWGAHIGVYLGETLVVHNSIVVGKPIIWPLSKFEEYERYQLFLGAKRSLMNSM